MGANDDPEANVVIIRPDGFGASFTDRDIRARFIRKVYTILLSQLSITVAIIAIFWFTPAIKTFYCDETYVDNLGLVHCTSVSTGGLVLYLSSYVFFLITYITLMCCEGVRRKSPINMVAMGMLTLAMSVCAASIAIYHDIWWVVMVMGITAAICLGLTLFSFQTKWDFTGWGIYLCAAAFLLFLFGVISIIFSLCGFPIVKLVYSCLVAMLFSAFLIYDTQLIMGGKKHNISPEDHVYAAVQLYVDVVYIFLAILGMGGRN